MIEALIGLALGAGGMWLWMRGARAERLTAARASRDYWKSIANIDGTRERIRGDRLLKQWSGAVDANIELFLAHSRCSDSQSILHDKVQQVRTLCSKRKDSTAIAVMKMIGDGK